MQDIIDQRSSMVEDMYRNKIKLNIDASLPQRFCATVEGHVFCSITYPIQVQINVTIYYSDL